jgi:hypothetical protein
MQTNLKEYRAACAALGYKTRIKHYSDFAALTYSKDGKDYSPNSIQTKELLQQHAGLIALRAAIGKSIADNYLRVII